MTDKVAFLDLEASGFLPIADKIWVVCIKMGGQMSVIHSREEFITWFDEHKPDRLVIHNGLGYDLLVLWIVWDVPVVIGKVSTVNGHVTQIVDTMLLSQRLNPDREGGHSLDNLAKLAGSHKDDYKGGWDAYSDEMRDYCNQDVEALEAVYHMLLKEVEKL